MQNKVVNSHLEESTRNFIALSKKCQNLTEIMSVMSDMVGKWKLEKRDKNFEEFLSCRQVGWFLRKLMTSSVADVEYSLSKDSDTFTKVTNYLST